MSLFPDLTNSPQGRNWGFDVLNTNFGLPLLDLKIGIRLEADLFNSNPPQNLPGYLDTFFVDFVFLNSV